MSIKAAHFLRPPEIFILITIVAMLAALTTVVVKESGKATRDIERKDDIGQFLLAAEAFKSDFGFYPNYTMVLGVGKDKTTNANYDLASPISVCPNYQDWAVASDLKTPADNLDKALLRPGFVSVSKFLQCLGYLKAVESDPLWAGTVADYHYRVSYNHQKVVVQTTTERSGLFLLGNGVGDKNLAEQSDASGYRALVGRNITNSRYLYQCTASADGKTLKAKERISDKYAPFIQDESFNWIANPACEDKTSSLLVVASR